MANPAGESTSEALRLDFDRRLLLQFRGSAITSDAGLLPYRELDDAVGLTDTGADTLADARTGKNAGHRLAGLLRQSVFGRLAGYEDVNDAERLCRDPAMRWVVGNRAGLLLKRGRAGTMTHDSTITARISIPRRGPGSIVIPASYSITPRPQPHGSTPSRASSPS
jgi:hypothetical protein